MNTELFRRYLILSLGNEYHPLKGINVEYYDDLFLDNLIAIELIELGCWIFFLDKRSFWVNTLQKNSLLSFFI